MTHLLVLVDYRRAFWSSTRNVKTLCSLDVDRLRSELTARGHDVEVLGFADLDLSRDDLTDAYAVYTSSEDVGGHYKRFIESKVFGLRLAGAHPIPDPELLLAHHDKTMMESIRQARLGGLTGQPLARTYGTWEELAADSQQWAAGPAVLKPAQGAGSRGVTLIHDRREGLLAARRLSRTLGVREQAAELSHRLRYPGYVRRSWHRRSVVVQQFLPGLSGDYKVLRYGERFYVLGRANRPGDFRASGSGRWDFAAHETADLTAVLDAARTWSQAIGSPFCSLDIAYDPGQGVEPHLIEFQCVNFGPGTAEWSTGYHLHGAQGWQRVEETCDLEAVFAEATSSHIAGEQRTPPGRR